MARRRPAKPATLLPYPKLGGGYKNPTYLVKGTAPNEGPNRGRPLTGINQKTGEPIYGPRPGGRRRALLRRMKP